MNKRGKRAPLCDKYSPWRIVLCRWYNSIGNLAYARAPLPMYASSLLALHLPASLTRSSLLAKFPAHCWHNLDPLGAPGAHDPEKKSVRSSSELTRFFCFSTRNGASQPAKLPLYPLWHDFLPLKSSETNRDKKRWLEDREQLYK